MQDCSTLDLDIEVSSSYILDRFTVLSELGRGVHGITVEVFDKELGKVSALKSLIYDQESKEFNDIVIGCRLTTLLQYTDSFMIPELWSVVDRNVFLDGNNPLLFNWIKYMYEDEDEGDNSLMESMINSKGLVYTMPVGGPTLLSLIESLDIEDLKDIIFEIIIALITMGRSKIEHGDFHLGNILLNNNEMKRVYNINGTEYIVKSKYQPIIIDFGEGSYPNKNIWDWRHFKRQLNYDILGKVDLDKMELGDETIVVSSIFSNISERVINYGESVKYFTPFDV